MAIAGSSRQTRALRSSDAVATCKPSALNTAPTTSTRVARERRQRRAAHRVPYPRRIVRGGGHDARAVRAECRAVYPVGMAGQLRQRGTGRAVP